MKSSLKQVLVLLTLSFLTLGGVAAVHAISNLPESQFVKKTRVPQMSLRSYSTFEEAATDLLQKKDAFLDSSITWTSERGDLTLTPRQLGVEPQSYDLIRDLNAFMEDSSAWEKVKIYFLGQKLDYPIGLNVETLKAAFAPSGIEQGTKNAAYHFEKGQVTILPEQIGYGIDTEQMNALIQQYWVQEFTAPPAATLPLRVGEPQYKIADLEPSLEAAQSLPTLTLQVLDEGGLSWNLPFEDSMDWVLPSADTTTEGPFNLDSEKVLADLGPLIFDGIESEPKSVVITLSEDQKPQFEGSARFGIEVDKTAFMKVLEQHFDELKTDPLWLPVTKIQPQIQVPESLAAQGVTGLLGVGHTNFSGSPTNRLHNIKHGTALFNGLMVAPGEEFSFVEHMGVVDGAHGWREELVIKGDETIPEYGGGICQISSTAYRAALFSGLPITARINHSYAVSYYARILGPGLDSTVYSPAPDSRWINDTQGSILIQAYPEGNDLYFVFYGAPDGRRVLMEGPYAYNYHSNPNTQITYSDELAPGVRVLDAYAHTGFEVDWYRTIFYGDGTQSERENIHSSYKATPAKYVEGRPEEAI